MVILAVVLVGAGCVPGEPPAPDAPEAAQLPAAPAAPVRPPIPPSEPEAAAPAAADADEPEEEETHQASLYIPSIELAQTEGVGAAVRPWPEERGHGFDVKGSYGLEGTIVPAADAEGQWVFKGHLTFPTGGFHLGEPWNQQQMGPEGVDQIIVMLPMSLPPKDAMVTQALDRREIDYRFEGAPNANFVVMFTLL
jgi:hypothetical protein